MVATRAAAPDGRLVAAATRLFAERGFDATPIQAIADEVGISKQALLHHFPSKEHLRQGVLSAILGHWSEHLPRLLLSATASEDRFDSVFGEVYRFFAAEPNRARFIAREAFDRPKEARELLRAVLPVIDAVAGYIRAGQSNGRHYADVDARAYVIHVLIDIIASVALAPVVTPTLGAGEAGRARYERELTRMAKASLFGSPKRIRTGSKA
jgi:AcrR family transcriptional regulator